MARARNIKPAFFKNDILAECQISSRLLFIGLWTLSDREGRLEDRPSRIRAEIFPYEELDVNELLNELYAKGFIIRYGNESVKYIQIVNFTKHQQPHYKEVASVIPPVFGWQDSGKTAGGVPERLRLEIINRDGKCLDCGIGEDLSLDHIIPRSLGGTNNYDNLQTLCRKCNSKKNNKLASSIQSSANVDPNKSLYDPLNPESLNPHPESLNPITDTRDLRPKRGRVQATKPPDVADQVWNDFLEHRKAKKAPVTETVIEKISREAKKAGWSFEDALVETVTRGWQSFKADWVNSQKGKENGNHQARFDNGKSDRARRSALAGLGFNPDE